MEKNKEIPADKKVEKPQKNKEIPADKKVEKPQKNKWKACFIGMSILSAILLITTIALATKPPRTEYVYETVYSSDDTDDDCNDGSASIVPSLSPSSSSTDSSETITYAPGEKVGTSAVGATVEVEEVVKHYQGYSNYYSSCNPESGYEYVLVKLSFENNSTNAIKLYSFDYYLEDSDGMMDDAVSNDSCYSGASTIFPFSKEIAGGGTKVSGEMLFPVRKGMTDSLIFLYEKDSPRNKISIKL